MVLELTHDWDTHRYDVGTGFGHIALGVEGIYDVVERQGAPTSRGQ